MSQEAISVYRTRYYDQTVIHLSLNNEDGTYIQNEMFDYPTNNEIDILDGHIFHEDMSFVFDSVPEFRRMKIQIVEAIHKMRENNLSYGIPQRADIQLLPKEILKPHTSCKINQDVKSNVEATSENENSQSELKQKLATLDKESEIMKFFEDNKCSVCLGNYKEILDEDLHIVVPSCGHPLCCKCADNLLESEMKECPQCRGKFTDHLFNLIKFNVNLEIDAGNQKLYL